MLHFYSTGNYVYQAGIINVDDDYDTCEYEMILFSTFSITASQMINDKIMKDKEASISAISEAGVRQLGIWLI